MKRIYLLFVLSYCISLQLIAQQRSTYNLYRENWMLLNPASFSEAYLINSQTQTFSATGRYQWSELENSPATVGLQFQKVLEEKNLAFGGSLQNDQTGAIGTTELHINSSYQLKIYGRQTQFISMGLNAGMVQYRVRFSEIEFSEPGASIPSENLQHYYPDFGIGAFYYLDNKIFAGFSIPQIFDLNTGLVGDFKTESVPHYLGMVGGFIPLRKWGKFSFLEPSAMIKKVSGIPVNFDLNLRYNHHNQLWIGLGYNNASGAHLETGFYIPNKWQSDAGLKIGMGYTLRTDALRQALGNTFELNVAWSWGQSTVIRCPF